MYGGDAERFERAYRAIYKAAVRRVPDRRAWLSPEARVILQHLADVGPLAIGEMAGVFGRAQSTITELVDGLVRQGVLDRMPDPADRRRSLVWLTEAGFARLTLETQVLDVDRIGRALARMSPAARTTLLDLLDDMIASLDSDRSES